MAAYALRSARVDDLARLARLFDQLGHPQPAGALRGSLESVLGDPRAGVIVAHSDGQLLGAAAFCFVPVPHETRPWCRITALVIDEAHRGDGIGRTLVEAVQVAARDAGCSRIEATSALHRADAHRFYVKLGYGQTSTHFLKRL